MRKKGDGQNGEPIDEGALGAIALGSPSSPEIGNRGPAEAGAESELLASLRSRDLL